MKTIPRLALVLLSLLMAVQLCACGSNPAESQPFQESSNDFWDESSDEPWSPDSSGETASSDADPSDPTGDASSGSPTTTKDVSGMPTSPTAPPIVRPPGTDDFVFPKINLTNKTVKFMNVGSLAERKIDQKVLDKLKDEYGATVQRISVGWGDLPLKLAASVLANDAPDAVLYRGDNPDMPSFVVKNLVQPIDSYINLNDPIYSYLKGHYQASSWGGKHYILISDYSRGSVLYYNTKMFKE